MQEALQNSEYASAIYDPTTRIVELVWKKDAGSEEYRKIFEAIVNFSDNNKIKSLLSDMRNEGLVRLEDVKWLEKEILARAVEYGLEKIALVVRESIFTTIYAEAIKKKLSNSPIKIQIFDRISEARSWLTSD